MAKRLAFILALCMALNLVAFAETYTATTTGMMGDVTVSAVVEDGVIKSISVDSHTETAGIGDVAVSQLPPKIVETQSLAVDVVTGATMTSNAIIKAVEEIAEKAGLDLEQLRKVPLVSETKAALEDSSADIVVVGGGGSGLTAAIKAAEAGKSVILLEKMPMLGGNTAMATTAFYAVGSYTQESAETKASAEEFYDWLISRGTEAFPMDPNATRTIVERAPSAANWMMDIGMDFGRVFNKFSHSPTDGSAPGAPIIATLKAKMDELGIDYRLSNKATSILLDEAGNLSGIEVETPNGNYTISTDAIILCAGGFAANPEMLAEYDERWATLGCSSSPGQNGDGIRMAMAIGADVVDMANIKVNPTVYYNGDQRISMSTLRSNGGLLVNKDGKRFFSESGNYTDTSAALLNQPNQLAFMVFDSTMLKIGLMAKYNEARYFVEAPTVRELSEIIGVNPEGLEAEIEKNKLFATEGVDKDFGRTNLTIKFDNPPFYAVQVYPAAQGTFGGLKVNTKAEVIGVDGNVILGLYAAGENAGEGTQGNCPLLENTVFGTIAAESAVELLDSKVK